ncbi:MAG: zinc-dependent metalloprotease [Chitinophagaceae bacterium]|nr:zinc-dependent metalloprotease [Chitinophagaceae bacterium]
MMKKLTLFSFALLLAGMVSFAQSVNPCGFDDLHKEMMRTDRNYEKAVRSMQNGWVKYAKMMSRALLTHTSKGYVYEIPMVMHVIHTGEAVSSSAKYNVDSLRIAQMIEYMNKNYAAEFPFPDTTTGASGGGTRIPLKFVLAKRTPAGLATNGIIRIDGTASYPLYNANGVKRSASTGVTTAEVMALSRWNPSDYYNVYIVNKIDGNDLYSSGGIAGYAYLPYFPTVDGMVVVASQVRSGSTTIAHEFGHAFSLLHTFEGDGGTATCPLNADCTTDGDMVCDTEPHYGSNHWPGWCPPSDANPCSSPSGLSYNGVIYNVMDYTNCDYSYPGSVWGPDRFTAGQRARVLFTLDNQHAAFKSSMGLVEPSGIVTNACVPTFSGTTTSAGPYVVEFNGMQVYTGDVSLEGKAYIDHAYTQQAVLAKGSTYPINVVTAGSAQKVKVFIDLNADGDFSDAGEEVFSHSSTSGGEVSHSGSIAIPSTATTCTWIRMRVVAALTSASITDMACGTYSNNAQAEDYGIFIQDSDKDTVAMALTGGTNPSCAGDLLTFTATPEKGTPAYRWFVNGVMQGSTTNTFSSATLSDGDIVTARTYYTTPCGDDSAISLPIVVNISTTTSAIVKNVLKSGSNPGCAGQTLVFKANVTGGGPSPIYEWKVNGTTMGAADTFASSSLAAGDQVWCYVTPNSACTTTPVNSDTITIAFGTVAASASIAVTSGTIPSCDSSYLTFTATPVNGGPAPKYQWYVNNAEVTGATNSFYTDQYLKNNDSVWCRVISNHACITPGSGDTIWSNRITVIRTPRTVPTLSVVISRGSNPGCLDSLLEFTATGTDAGGSPTMIWYINGALAGYGSVFGSSGFLNNDTITCKMEVTAGSCNTIDSLVWGPLVLKRSATPGSPIISLIGTMLVSSITTDIQWYGPDGIIPGATGSTYHPTKEGNYYAVIVNNGCNGAPSNVLNVSLLAISPYNMNEVRIYPNPTSGILNFDFGTEKMNGTIEVFTALGQKVLATKVEDQAKLSINLNQFANGNYFVVVHDNNSGKKGTVSVTVAH